MASLSALLATNPARISLVHDCWRGHWWLSRLFAWPGAIDVSQTGLGLGYHTFFVVHIQTLFVSFKPNKRLVTRLRGLRWLGQHPKKKHGHGMGRRWNREIVYEESNTRLNSPRHIRFKQRSKHEYSKPNTYGRMRVL